jgi:hypothetical protein
MARRIRPSNRVIPHITLAIESLWRMIIRNNRIWRDEPGGVGIVIPSIVIQETGVIKVLASEVLLGGHAAIAGADLAPLPIAVVNPVCQTTDQTF